MPDHNYFSNLIWQIADLLRGPYRPPQYERVMLPMTVLRRFDCVLATSKITVLKEYARRKGGKLTDDALDRLLSRAAGQRFARYRRTDPGDRSDFVIGCRILTQPFFLDEVEWISVPPSFARNIVTFKTYSTDEADGRGLWDAVQERMARNAAPLVAREAGLPRYGNPTLIRPRLGQGAFRIVVTDAYHRRCAVTGERTLPALEAAHIKPYADGGSHEPTNGLLMRRDIHALFDGGYVTVTPDLRFHVSRRIKEEFENGRDYYRMHGQPVALPQSPLWRPDSAALRWHNGDRYLD